MADAGAPGELAPEPAPPERAPSVEAAPPPESADEVVEHFFEGLDEDAFIADLHVVSSWDDSPTNGPPRDDSALSIFKSFLSADPKPKPEPAAKRRPRDETAHDDAKLDLGPRRDPDKTKRDIERDKVNKTKETLIKKMETGLIPPGMEMEQSDETAAEAKRRASPPRRGSRSRSKSDSAPRRRAKMFEPRRREPDRFRNFESRTIVPFRAKRVEPYDRRRRTDYRTRSRSRSRSRSFSFSPHRSRRSSRPQENYVQYLTKRDSFSPPRQRRSSKPKGEYASYVSKRSPPPRPRRISKPNERFPSYGSKRDSPRPRRGSELKENFLSFLSKHNLIPQSNSAASQPPPQPVPPPSYVPVDMSMPPPFVIDSSFGSVPPHQSATPTLDENYSTAYPTASYGLLPVETVPQGYDELYTNIAPPEIAYNGFAPPPAEFDSNFVQMNAVVDPGVQYVDNSYTAFKDQEKRTKIIKNCESILKKLNNLQTENCIATNSKEDSQQRDCAFTSPKKDINYRSPLNRDSAVHYDFTKTGDKNRMIVPSIISTLQGEDSAFLSNIQKNIVKKNVSSQTVSAYCDRCQLKDDINKVSKQTSTINKTLYRSVHCQVREEDLASSKFIFKPNQNTLPEPEKPVSLAHMTPAQLVAELTAKAKSMQRIAVDNFRQAGGNLDDSNMRKNMFPYRETNQSNTFISNFNNSNAIPEVNIMDRKPRKRKPNYH